MRATAKLALDKTNDVAAIIHGMIPYAKDFDLERLLKQIEADIMDLQHKLSMAVKLSPEDKIDG